EVLAGGDGDRAADIFAQIIEIAPDSAPAHAGSIRASSSAGRKEEAAEVSAALDPGSADDPASAQARSASASAEDAPEAGESAGSRAAAEADPADMDAQLAYANALYAGGDRDAAAATSSRMIAADREWNEGAARARSLQIFEAIGSEDPWVAATRRKSSTGSRLSIFPRPGATSFPGRQSPLHIFEPRYRASVSDASARDRRIAMIQPQAPAEGAPSFSVGCVGKIGEVEASEDGRYNIVSQGLSRFRVRRESDVTTPFRQVEAESIEDDPDAVSSAVERASFEREARIFADAQGYAVDWESVTRSDDMASINGVSQIVPFDIAAKQASSEAPDLATRCESSVQLSQFFGRRDSDDNQVTSQ
ncbi:hypothetical protein OY671_007735, partial [Metschnikowia pulcherrima]